MNNADTTLPMAQPPISSSTNAQPQATLLQRGAFDPPLTPGTLGTLDRFEILRLLGEGGMGQVYLAREPRTDTRVAIKIMRPQLADDPRLTHSFLTEARHMYRLSHPRILRVLEVSDRKEGPYFVMPYIEGGSLLDQCRSDGRLSDDRVLSVARQVAEALAHAHARGLIHRDLKPGNVLLDKDGNAYLTDFGLVRTVFNDSMVDASESHIEGTAPYMSPAVARGEAEDTRCDIYAFGALLYELLTGRPPYTGRTPQIILDQVLQGPPSSIRTVNPKANLALVKIAEGCMARELRDRYAAMADVVADLDRAAKGMMPFGPHRQQRGLPRRAALFAGALVVAALAGVAVHHSLRLVQNHSLPVKLGGAGSPSTLPATEGVKETPSSGALAQTDTSAETAPSHFTCITNNGTITIINYTGPGGKVVIPGTINRLLVSNIGKEAFADQSGITNVMIKNGVTHIVNMAFYKCNRLNKITIPRSVVYLNGGAFTYCNSLMTIDVDTANLAYRTGEDGVVFDNRKVKLVAYPGGKAGHYTIPDSVTSIEECAFGGCTNLTGVTIPGNVTTIGSWAFNGCSGLTSVLIPIGTTKISEHAFRKCSSLTDVTISESIVSIGMGAYSECNALTAVYFEGNAPWIDRDVFRDSKKATVYYRPGTKGWGKEFGGRPTAVWNPEVPFTYTVINGAVTITKYTGPGGAVTIPSTIGGLPVTVIQDAAFFYCRELTGVVLPKNVTSIGGGVFPFCDRLASIEVDPENPAYYSTKDGVLFNKDKTCLVRYPGGKSGSYAIPRGVKNIGDNAFGGWSKLDSVTIPNGVTNIGQFAFDSCNLLTGIAIPESVTSLGTGAFQCGGLKTVMIPKTTTAIANYVFTDCRQLKAISVDEENPAYCGVDGVLFDKARTRLISYPGGKGGSYQVPDGVDEINPAAFNGCACLPSVTLPASVTRVGRDSFAKCGDLTAVYFNGNAPWADENVFAESKKVVAYYRPGTTGWGPAFGGRTTAVWQEKAQTETDVHDFACVAENGGVAIVKYTGEGGAVVIPSKVSGLPVTTIKDQAFANCTSLTSVTIPASVTVIGEYAFDGCSGLRKVTIPKSVASISGNSFAGCRGLALIEVDAENLAYSGSEDGVLFNRDRTRLVIYPGGKAGSYGIPKSVTTVGHAAFSGCVQLTGVTIPSSVTKIEEAAFIQCSGLTNVALPSSVTSIGVAAFCNCQRLNAFVVDAANPAYSGSADGVLFDKEMKGLVSYPGGKAGDYEIPANVTAIAPSAFRGCGSVTRVTIPASVASIGKNAFVGCGDLRALCFKGNAPRFDNDVLADNKTTTIYHLPDAAGWGPTFGGRPTAVWKP